MKRFLSVILAICFIFNAFALPVFADRQDVDIDVGNIFKPDINGDDVFDMKDIVLSAKKAAGWDVDGLILKPEYLDANEDNVVNLSDTVSLARVYLDWAE